MSQTSASVGSSNRIDLPASSSHVSHFRFMFSLTSVTVNALDDRNVFQALLDEFPPWHVKPFFFVVVVVVVVVHLDDIHV